MQNRTIETLMRYSLLVLLAQEHGKEELSLEVIYFAMTVGKNQTKFQNFAFLLVKIQSWIDFYRVCKNQSSFGLKFSGCSRDSRPRDWFRLMAIFLVLVSPNISRDSRD